MTCSRSLMRAAHAIVAIRVGMSSIFVIFCGSLYRKQDGDDEGDMDLGYTADDVRYAGI